VGDNVSPWTQALFGVVPIVMGLVILGALAGTVPTDGGTFFAPPWVIVALGTGLILFGLMLWLPRSTPSLLRNGVAMLVVVLVAGVCNWTAFTPGVRYTSEVTLGGWTTSGEDPVGGRIVFGLVALVIDAVLAVGIFDAIRRALRRG
jgi:hypothetical protein